MVSQQRHHFGREAEPCCFSIQPLINLGVLEMFSFKIGKGMELRWGFAYLEADYSYPNCMMKAFVLQRASLERLS